MGKPFKKELAIIPQTIQEVNEIDLSDFITDYKSLLTCPLIAIGSGGSLSACYFAEILHQQTGNIAKAITPLEVQSSLNVYRRNNVLIISASGKNKDILLAFNSIIGQEPNRVISLSTKLNSPLKSLSEKTSVAKNFGFTISAGKDGFLASNSLVTFFMLLSRAYGTDTKNLNLAEENGYLNDIDKFSKGLIKETTFIVLYSGWSKPVAIDIESKFSEAALGSVLLSDYRNFGHGRHHWFDKRRENSVIISLINPDDVQLAEKTLQLLPSDIPILKLVSKNKGAISTIDLLIQSFHFADKIGEKQSIDPGRPGVPDYGSKLYNLNYTNLIKKRNLNEEKKIIAISRKIYPLIFNDLQSEILQKWETSYNSFRKKIKSAEFGCIVLDYDRTLCSDARRLDGPEVEIIEEITRITKLGYLVAIITGRGQSAKKDLQKLITDESLYNNIIIGYYNGSDIGLLSSNDLPNIDRKNAVVLEKINDELKKSYLNEFLNLSLRPDQLTIEVLDGQDWRFIKPAIYNLVMDSRDTGFIILESSRSIDIISRPKVSKLNIISYCQEELNKKGLSDLCLCIGDKGRYPGNDFELLSHPYSLSVDEVSTDMHSCWNLSPKSVNNTDSCLLYLKSLKGGINGLIFDYE
jgi:hydroxymethylpyrimidine pyrophosphatase-like HAD family hydrolase